MQFSRKTLLYGLSHILMGFTLYDMYAQFFFAKSGGCIQHAILEIRPILANASNIVKIRSGISDIKKTGTHLGRLSFIFVHKTPNLIFSPSTSEMWKSGIPFNDYTTKRLHVVSIISHRYRATSCTISILMLVVALQSHLPVLTETIFAARSNKTCKYRQPHGHKLLRVGAIFVQNIHNFTVRWW